MERVWAQNQDSKAPPRALAHRSQKAGAAPMPLPSDTVSHNAMNFELGPNTEDQLLRQAPQLSKRTLDCLTLDITWLFVQIGTPHAQKLDRHTQHFGEQSLGVGHPTLGRSEQCKFRRLNAETRSVTCAAAFMRSLVLLTTCVATAVWQDPQRTPWCFMMSTLRP